MSADPSSSAAICAERFEPTAKLDRTHSCSLAAGHGGPHVCPLCSEEWERTDAD